MSSSLHYSPVADNLLPKGRDERQKLAIIIGMDRMMLVDAIYSEDSLYWPRELPAVERLRLHHSAVNPLGSVENCLSKPVDNGIVC